MAKLNDCVAVFEQLKVEFNRRDSDTQKCGDLLAKLKILLTELSFLSIGKLPPVIERIIAREVLEIGALWSVRVQDIPSFERYIAQLKVYYQDLSSDLPPSERKYMLLGLNLLRLLSQNRIAEFHTELELIEVNQLHESVYIKHPVEIEQWLMEGSYNKVVSNRQSVPADEFLFFINILISTIRNEIADCSEKAYDSLPIASAIKLMYFDGQHDFLEFAKERKWDVDLMSGLIDFHKQSERRQRTDIPAQTVIKHSLHYARELERIV